MSGDTPGAAPRAEDVRHDLAVTAGSDDQDHRDVLPMNSCAVACPGWLIPRAVTTFQTVSARILTSSANEQVST